jgi:hypothetical protein
VCVLEKNTREFVRELREVEEEQEQHVAAPTSMILPLWLLICDLGNFSICLNHMTIVGVINEFKRCYKCLVICMRAWADESGLASYR